MSNTIDLNQPSFSRITDEEFSLQMLDSMIYRHSLPDIWEYKDIKEVVRALNLDETAIRECSLAALYILAKLVKTPLDYVSTTCKPWLGLDFTVHIIGNRLHLRNLRGLSYAFCAEDISETEAESEKFISFFAQIGFNEHHENSEQKALQRSDVKTNPNEKLHGIADALLDELFKCAHINCHKVIYNKLKHGGQIVYYFNHNNDMTGSVSFCYYDGLIEINNELKL